MTLRVLGWLMALTVSMAGSVSVAGEVKGQQLIPMLSGKQLACYARGKRVKLKFEKVSAKSTSIPFSYAFASSSGKGTYVLTKSGRLKHKETGATRKIGFNKKKKLTITGGGAPSAICDWP